MYNIVENLGRGDSNAMTTDTIHYRGTQPIHKTESSSTATVFLVRSFSTVIKITLTLQFGAG